MDLAESRSPRSSASSYDAFSYAYNRHWGPVSLKWLSWVGLLVVPRISARARVLDLCCGAGQLCGELSGRGLKMVGLDGSRAMLRHARKNAPGVPLVQGDARMFGLRPRFDAVLCLFDSLNHLLSAEDLAMAFHSICVCLKPGGWLLFDVNTELGYALYWNGEEKLESDDSRVHTWSEYDAKTHLAGFRATVERFDGAASATEEAILWQRCHSHEEIQEALTQAGFSEVETYGLEDDSLVTDPLGRNERAFYLCRRPLAGKRHKPL